MKNLPWIIVAVLSALLATVLIRGASKTVRLENAIEMNARGMQDYVRKTEMLEKQIAFAIEKLDAANLALLAADQSASSFMSLPSMGLERCENDLEEARSSNSYNNTVIANANLAITLAKTELERKPRHPYVDME